VAACLGMAWWERRMNRLARSEFVALDSRSWLMSGAISGALVVAFGLGLAVERGPYGWLAPYLDPAVLGLVCLVILPLPMGALRDAVRDIFMVAPGDLDAEVRAAAEAAAARHGFADWRSYVARAGRSAQIEIYLIAAPGRGVRDLAELDAIRDEIGAEIGGRGPNRWLTIVFTTRRDWAE
jgi:predicted Co/Zn/Cd cation transporter (cation efflux family)